MENSIVFKTNFPKNFGLIRNGQDTVLDEKKKKDLNLYVLS